ncbi:hypothetical protein ABEB36_013544 [Hypothenemus hampei]|uniref:Uncharacterized protein n=1 Tax=Hypothenemus hampei TaxID=57062 RepID=A0ABD1E5H0_HYPHA
MKYIVCVLVCALVAGALAKPEISASRLEESRNRMRNAHKTCQGNSATAVDEAALKTMLQNPKAPRPENIGPHALCVSKALGWQNEDGSVNRDEVESRAKALYGDNERLQQLVNECTAPQSSPEEAALKLIGCYRANAPRPTNAS